MGLALFGILFIFLFLDSYPRSGQVKKDEKRSIKDQFALVKETLVHLKKPNQILIIPITLWLGFEQAFIGADFTKVFLFI